MSPAQQNHYDALLYNYETTALTDFRLSTGTVKTEAKTKHSAKPHCLRLRPPGLKDLHSMTDWKVPNVPFSLMHGPKEIVRTNPWIAQEPFSKPEDQMREHIQRTRPRVVMTPALFLDDIEDRCVRDKLIDDVYLTSFAKVERNSGTAGYSSIRAPLSRAMAPANPICLRNLQAPYVSPEWRMDSASWDSLQLRSYCTPTRKFWLNRTPKSE